MTTTAGIRVPALPLAVAAAAALWLFGFQTSVGGPPTDPPPDLGYYLQLGIVWVFLVTPWLVALHLLRRRRSAAAEVGGPRPDLPAQLVAFAVLTLPEDRRSWGAAMTAELAAVREPAARRRFAAGCVRAALFPPSLQSGAIRRPGSGRALTATAGAAAVVACLGATAYFLIRYPTAALHLSPAYFVLLAATMAAFGWLALRPPPLLTADRAASRIAVGAALTIAAGLLLTSRLGLRGVAGLDVGVLPYLYLIPIAVVFAGSAWAAARHRSFRAGVQTAVWTVLLASLLTYAVALTEAVRWYAMDASLILASDAVPLDAVGENLRNFTWSLLLPFWWLPFGIVGGWLTARASRGGTERRSAPSAPKRMRRRLPRP